MCMKATRALPLAFVLLASLLGSLLSPPAAMAAAGVPDHLQFGQQPSDVQSDADISPAVTVQVLDSDGNLVTDPVNVTVALSGGDSSATLGGTATQTTSGGVATFPDLTVDKTGSSYVLTASLPDFSAVQPLPSDPFDVTPGAPESLQFDQQPTNTAAGAVISPAVTVDVLDHEGNLVTDQSVDVTVVLSGGDPNAGLGGTPTQSSVNGVATFDDLSVDKVGTGYRLTASSGGLTGDQSDPFDITAGSGTHLKFSGQPSDVVAGKAITPPVTVQVLDAEGNLVQDPTSVKVSLSGGDPNATLHGTTTKTSAGGVATFDDLWVDKADSGYTLVASSGSLQTDTSDAFKVSPAVATQLGFTAQPQNTLANAQMPPVVVSVEDQFANVVTSWNTGSITLKITRNPAGGTLTGTNPRVVKDGQATFSNLSINRSGVGYLLGATGLKLTAATSHSFNILGKTTVTFSVSSRAIGYGQRVTLTAHITNCLDPCELSIYRLPKGGVKTLVVTERVNSRHSVVWSRAPGVNTLFWAEFAGDRRYLPAKSPQVNVLVHVLVREDLGGRNQAGHDGAYQLFHYSSACARGNGKYCPFIRATLIPETKQGQPVKFVLEALVNGRWQEVSHGTNTIGGDGTSLVAWVYGGRSVIGVRLRTRASYGGDDFNSGAVNGPWRYFRIV
jgi:hypothetical protein